VLKVDFAALAAQRPASRCAWWATCPTTSPRRSCSTCCGWRTVVADQHFMLQKEVVERMAAAPGGKDYGRLSVMLQWRYRIEACWTCRPRPSTRRRAWTRPWCAWSRCRPTRWPWTRRGWARWWRWPSRSAASCCATRWALARAAGPGRSLRPAAPRRGSAGGRVPGAGARAWRRALPTPQAPSTGQAPAGPWKTDGLPGRARGRRVQRGRAASLRPR
jgi:hypothetical protein